MNSQSKTEDQSSDLELLKPEQVAKLFKVSKPHVYAMASRGQLPCVKWSCDGKRETVRFLKEDVFKFIRDHRKDF